MPGDHAIAGGPGRGARTSELYGLESGSSVGGGFELMRLFRRSEASATPAALWRAGLLSCLTALTLAGCATTPQRVAYHHGKEYFPSSIYGAASPRVVADGEPIPRGGGQYLVGHPYSIAGRTYVPTENSNYSAVGMASWYGDAFRGRRTANGEVYDVDGLTAAHPTMPLPSYARVTNLGNGYSVIVRVNDRGPFHGGRVMDVSSRVADVLDFKNIGTARIKVDYVGRAPLAGSDDNMLLASLRTDGAPARLNGMDEAPTTMVADNETPRATTELTRLFAPHPPRPKPVEVASANAGDEAPARPPPRPRFVRAPLPPERPFDLGAAKPAKVVALAATGKPALRLTSSDRALYFAPVRRGPANDPFAKLIERGDARPPSGGEE